MTPDNSVPTPVTGAVLSRLKDSVGVVVSVGVAGHPAPIKVTAITNLETNTGASVGTTIGSAGGVVHNCRLDTKSLDPSSPPGGKCPALTVIGPPRSASVVTPGHARLLA